MKPLYCHSSRCHQLFSRCLSLLTAHARIEYNRRACGIKATHLCNRCNSAGRGPFYHGKMAQIVTHVTICFRQLLRLRLRASRICRCSCACAAALALAAALHRFLAAIWASLSTIGASPCEARKALICSRLMEITPWVAEKEKMRR